MLMIALALGYDNDVLFNITILVCVEDKMDEMVMIMV
jgi:hypothetical protein